MRKPNHYGYYVFLGLGDFGAPSTLGTEWTSRWDLSIWEKRIDDFVRLGTNTLFLYLMGHTLPYDSKKFPEYVEKGHPNVKHDFLQTVLDLCTEREIELVAVFSTTGHAKAYTSAHPELSICGRNGEPEEVNRGIMCHHKEEARKYAVGVIDECLERYHGFSAVILHPPEFGIPCFCNACNERYEALHGQSLSAASDEQAKEFFMATNLLFQRTVVEAHVCRHLPGARLLTFTIPWIFETQFEQVAREIDLRTIIVEWDYGLSEDRISELQSRLRRYQQLGHEVWFMPTSGYAFAEDRSSAEQANAVLRQIQLCLEVDVTDIVYFMGPTWWPTVEQTSWHLRVET